MSFPLTVAGHAIADPPAFAQLVRTDCGPGPGRVVAGKRPAEWILDLVERGILARRLAVGLAAALIQQPSAAEICEAARLSRALGDPALGALMLRALEAHDTALLLANDPGDHGGSVEDALLGAVAGLCDFGDQAVRRSVLERMRHAGLRALELPILLAHGDPHDLREWLPAVLAEDLAEAEIVLVRERAAEDDEGGRIVASLLAFVRASAAPPT